MSIDTDITIIRAHVKNQYRYIEHRERGNITDKDRIEIGKQVEFLKSITKLTENYQANVDKAIGKAPPTVIDLEQSVLGAILLESKPKIHDGKIYDTSALDKVSSFLFTSHFYHPPHVNIYSAVLSLHKQKLDIDMRTVVIEMRRLGTIDISGGAHYIAELTSKVSSAANIRYHSSIMVEHSIKRELIQLCAVIMHDSYEDSTDCFELIDRLQSGIDQINKANIRK